MKKQTWTRKCPNPNNNPNCRKEIKYKNETFYLTALNRNTLCRGCSQYKSNNPQFNKPSWNKGLTKETDDRIKKYGETYTKNYNDGKIKNVSGKNNGMYNKEHSEKSKELMKLNRPDYSGKNNPMFGKHHSVDTIKKIFSHKEMNKTEKIVADLLDANNIKYYFQFFISEGKLCKSYDFKIKNKSLIIEVDGDFWHGGPSIKDHWKQVETVKQNDKIKDELASSRGYTVIRIWESDIKNNMELVTNQLLNNIRGQIK